jgi:hypothetical protein
MIQWKNILKQRLIAESQRDNIPVAINPSRSVLFLSILE